MTPDDRPTAWWERAKAGTLPPRVTGGVPRLVVVPGTTKRRVAAA